MVVVALLSVDLVEAVDLVSFDLVVHCITFPRKFKVIDIARYFQRAQQHEVLIRLSVMSKKSLTFIAKYNI